MRTEDIMAAHGLGHVRFVANNLLTVPGEPITERRTWRDRLLSWPWRPWMATRVVVPQVPDPNLYFYAGQTTAGFYFMTPPSQPTYIGHPETIRAFCDKLQAGNFAQATADTLHEYRGPVGRVH